MPQWNRRGFSLGNGPHLVIEGDEYNTAFFDRGPKFLHYRPHLFLIGPVEFDHADLYPDLDAVLTAFRAGSAQVPRHGAVIANAWSEGALAACRDATAPLIKVGPNADCDLRMTSWSGGPDASTAEIEWRGERFRLKLDHPGLHNLQNAAVAAAAAINAGVPPATAAEALTRFPGVARRMEVVGEVSGVTVVDDFAHHPTAIEATVAAARQRWPDRRLVIAFEPRSLTAARRSFEDAYVNALASADVVMVAVPYHRNRLDKSELLDRTVLAERLTKHGVVPVMPADDEDPVEILAEVIAGGDVVVGCSSGDFGGFHSKLITVLTRGGEG